MKNKDVYKKCLEFKDRTGRWPRAQIKMNKTVLSKRIVKEFLQNGVIGEHMYNELMEEITLNNKWKTCEEHTLLVKYSGVPITEVPKKYRGMIDTLRGFGLGYPGGKIDIVERFESFYKKHGRVPGWLPMKRSLLTDSETAERRLYELWVVSDAHDIFKSYIDKPIDEIPEEHQETIRRLKAIGMGLEKKKSTLEDYMDFVRENAREPIHYINPAGRDEVIEHGIKQRWRGCKAHFTYEKYKGVFLDEIPEEDRPLVSELRKMWLEVDGEHVMEEVFDFIDKYKREPIDSKQGRSTFGKELTEEGQKEADLAARWSRCFEKQVMDRFSKRKNIPQKYKNIMVLLRERNLGYPESFNTRMYIKFTREHGFVPRQCICKKGARIPRKYYTDEEVYEISIRRRFYYSDDKRIYDEYKAGTLDERTLKIYENMLKELDEINAIDKSYKEKLSEERKEQYKISMKEKVAKRKAKKAEKNAQKDARAAEGTGIKVIDKVSKDDVKVEEDAKPKANATAANESSEVDTERKIQKTAEQSKMEAMLNEKEKAMELAKIFINFVKGNGRFPRETIKHQGVDINKKGLTPAERFEQLLRRSWDRCNFMEVVEAYAGTPIECVPEEYQILIAEFRSQGFGLTADEYYKYRINLTPDQVLRYVKNTRDMAKSKKIKAMMLEQEVLDQLRQKGKEQDDE